MKAELAQFQKLAQNFLEAEEAHAVVPPIKPEDLLSVLDLTLDENPIPDEKLYAIINDIILHVPRLNTNRFFNQLFGGRNAKASLADLLVVLLNNTMHTYKVSGPMVGVEKELIANIVDLAGYPEGSDGTLTTGGSLTNLMGMIMARDHYSKDIRFDGVESNMVIYTSRECHYSISKNASFIGIGRNNVRYIESDDFGKMRMDKLEEAIVADQNAGKKPFMVNGTLGTTVMGAIDPLDEIGEICKKHDLWFHIDGAYYGSLIFSHELKPLIKGIEKSDSFSVNAHKMLSTPVTCSVIITKDKRQLVESFNNEASYLYQLDQDEYNLGRVSVQCGRRNDAFKFWTYWKSVGTKGLAKHVEHEFALAKVARDYVRNHPDYRLYSFEDSINICFNYKDIPADRLCAKLYEEADLMVGYGIFKETMFIRLVTINANNSPKEILDFFAHLEKFAETHF
jgi:sulfinoalanine decarboxylase/sulfinoalanine decarboxylase/aspartate 1-decarboxylase